MGPYNRLGEDIKELQDVVKSAIEEQMKKGAERGYYDWQQANTLHLVTKAVKAVATGNYKSAIAYAAMLLWQHLQVKNELGK